MSQESIKIQLDKINSLFEVFFKDGINNTSKLERDLLKIQLNSLIREIDNLDTNDLTASSTSVYNAVQQVEDVASAIDKSYSEGDSAPEIQPINEEEKTSNETNNDVEENTVAENIATKEENMESESSKKEVKIQFISDDIDENKEDLQEKIFTTNKPTRNLKEVIDLNKSFVFRGELFANNNEEYQAFIEKLNSIEDEEASFKFVEETAKIKAWDKEAKVYELLLRAVEKRFLPLI